MNAKAMGKLTSIAILLKDEHGNKRLVEFIREYKIKAILDDNTCVGDFIRDCAGFITEGDPPS